MPLDPQVRHFLVELKTLDAKPPWEATLEDLRAAQLAKAKWGPSIVDIPRIEDFTIPGQECPIPVRLYSQAPEGLEPVLIWYHGGGFVTGSIEGQDNLCRTLADRSACAVLAVDYRLAPEHKFPAASDDALAVLEWVAAHGEERGLDSDRMAVAGDSAGANLATVAVRRARDRESAMPSFHALVYPLTDATMNAESYRTYATGHMLTARHMQWYFDQYLTPDKNRRCPEVSPLLCKSLEDLPATLIITAECDPLRDEGEDYAKALELAGVPVALSRYPGMIHGFFAMSGVFDAAHEAIDELTRSVLAAIG